MKNKPQMMGQRDQDKTLDWLYHEEGDGDFLMGMIPKDLSDTWEEEE